MKGIAMAKKKPGKKKAAKKTKIERVRVSELNAGPIRHEPLSAELLEGLKFAYDTVGHFIHPTWEQWQIDFMRDMHSEKEIHTWLRIALSWQIYHERFVKDEVLSDEQEKDLVGTLVQISMGVIEPKQLSLVTKPVGQGLVKCWTDVFDDLSKVITTTPAKKKPAKDTKQIGQKSE
jgi:hypothetical protein